MDFYSDTTEILLNPRIDPAKRARIVSLAENRFTGHLLIASSGTTKTDPDDFKLVALSKKAILASAHAVNQHLDATSNDVWLNSLPDFHVGGLGIFARAQLSGSKVVLLARWDPQEFVNLIASQKVTLTSLVPAQVFDLCVQQLKAPEYLRVVIVGGGAITEDLYEKAFSLGWPLLVSYGLTECASQVATSTLNSKSLKLLSHVEAKVSNEGFLMFKSTSLLSAYLFINGNEICISDPKSDGWLTSEDIGLIVDKTVSILGRSADFIKIGGEGVHFSQLEKRFEEIKFKCNLVSDAAIIAFPDDRLGFVVHLASTSSDTKELVERFNSAVMPYERIRHTHFIEQIPRTALKKLCKTELLHYLTNSLS